MINNSLIKVQVKEYTSPAKPQRKLIYQRIKPYMEAYGISPEVFEIKGKSVVFKNNNPNNITQLNKIQQNKILNLPQKETKPKNISQKTTNSLNIIISQSCLAYFQQSIQQKPQVQQPQKVEQFLIMEEPDDASDSSYIKKHEMMLKDIAELEKVKQEKILELEMLQNKIDEAKTAEINSSRFIIKKSVHKPTIRERKDKAASLIQAHVKGRIDYKRFVEWKKKKEDKLRKVIFIQAWWKMQMKHLRIQKQFRIAHQSKQVRSIDGHTFLIITNYSYTLYRIRLLFIERMGVIKGDFRLYLNQQNCAELLNEDISKKTIEFVSLMNIIINNLIKLIQIQDSCLIFELQKYNLIDIPRLELQVCLNVNPITGNQYQLVIHQAEPEKQLIISKDQIESSNQTPIITEQMLQTLLPDQQQENKEDHQIEQEVTVQTRDEKEKNQNNELLCQNIELSEDVRQKENTDILQYQSKEEINNNEQNQNKEVLEDGNDVEGQKLLNSQIYQNNQSYEEIINKANIPQQNQEQMNEQSEFQQSDKEQKNEQDHQDDQKNDEVQIQQENQTTHQIQLYAIQDPLNSQIQQDYLLNGLKLYQQNKPKQFYYYNKKLIIIHKKVKLNFLYLIKSILNFNNTFQIQRMIKQKLNKIKFCEGTQILQNEILSSQRSLNNNNEKQTNQQEMSKNNQDDQEFIIKNKKEDVVEGIEQNQEEIIQNQQGDREVLQQQVITNNVQEDLEIEQNQEQTLEIMQKKEIENDTAVVENKVEEFEQIDIKHEKSQEIQEDEEQQIVKSEQGIQQNSNVLSNKIEKEQSQQSFKKKDNDQNQLQLPSQIDFHLLKSCESNFFEPPYSGKETIKYLNSGELLSRTNFLSQLGQLGKFDQENNSLLGSGDLKKDIEGLPEPLNLRNKNNNQQELFSESQTFANRMASDFRSPFIDDTFKLSTTFKFQFSSEIKAFESGQFISQQFDIKIQQQDSLEYSMDESQDLQPIYITTMKVDDTIYYIIKYIVLIQINIIQQNIVINTVMMQMYFKQKMFQDLKIRIIYINPMILRFLRCNNQILIIQSKIYMCTQQKIVLIVQMVIKQQEFKDTQRDLDLFNHAYQLLIRNVFQFVYSNQIKMSFYGQIEFGEQIIIEKMTIKQRRTLQKYFYSICPQLLLYEKGLEQKILATIEALDIQG